jgi:hypothetical protein
MRAVAEKLKFLRSSITRTESWEGHKEGKRGYEGKKFINLENLEGDK